MSEPVSQSSAASLWTAFDWFHFFGSSWGKIAFSACFLSVLVVVVQNFGLSFFKGITDDDAIVVPCQLVGESSDGVPQKDQWAGMSVLSFGPKVRGPRTHSIMLKKKRQRDAHCHPERQWEKLEGGAAGLLVLSGCGGVSLRTAEWRGFSRGSQGFCCWTLLRSVPRDEGFNGSDH